MDLGAYEWLAKETAPRILVEAVKLYGITETPGRGDTAAIMAWAQEVGLSKVFTADATAWCGLFAAVCAQRAGYEPPSGPLAARSWSRWGTAVTTPMLGDVLVFSRPGGAAWSGHVGLYVGEDDHAFHVLGGNQSDAVRVSRLAKTRLLAARRSPWKIRQPSSVRRVILLGSGALSVNEA